MNYTVMLLPHSQKKPIHFKIPVWVFGMFFLMIMTLVGGVLFFAGSTHQLRPVELVWTPWIWMILTAWRRMPPFR